MRHARPDDLVAIAPLLDRVRQLGGMIERKPGTFYRKRDAFLHFHTDGERFEADVRIVGEWQRHPATTPPEQADLLGILTAALSDPTARVLIRVRPLPSAKRG